MIGRVWRLAVGYVALVLMILALALSGSHVAQLMNWSDKTTLTLTTSVDAQEALHMQRVETRATTPLSFALWGQQDGQMVENPDFQRVSGHKLSVLVVGGDSTLPFPQAVPLSPTDSQGCLLDRESAYQLFGDYNGVGQQVRWQNRNYTVRGVFSSPTATMVVSASGQSDFPLNRITLVESDSSSSRFGEEFLQRHGLSATLEVSNSVYTMWSAMFARLVALCMAVLLFLRLLGEMRTRRSTPVIAALYGVAAGAALVLLLWAGGFRGEIPQSMIPTRWSNFEFWKSLANQWKALLLGMLYSKKDCPDILLLGHFLSAVLWGLAALGLFLWKVQRMTLPDSDSFFATELVSLLTAFAAVLWVSRLGRSTGFPQLLWLATPIYFFFVWGIPAVREVIDLQGKREL